MYNTTMRELIRRRLSNFFKLIVVAAVFFVILVVFVGMIASEEFAADVTYDVTVIGFALLCSRMMLSILISKDSHSKKSSNKKKTAYTIPASMHIPAAPAPACVKQAPVLFDYEKHL